MQTKKTRTNTPSALLVRWFSTWLSAGLLTKSLSPLVAVAQTPVPPIFPNPIPPSAPQVPAPQLPVNSPSPLQTTPPENESSLETATPEIFDCKLNPDTDDQANLTSNPSEQSTNNPGVPETATLAGFVFTGNTAFSSHTLSTEIEYLKNIISQNITFAQLNRASSEVTKFYNDRHYINSYAVIPPQNFTQNKGIVTIQIVEGSIETLRIIRKGSRHRLNPNYVCERIRNSTKPLNVKELLNALQLLQLDPLIENISADLRPGTQPERSELEVRVTEAPSFSAGLNLDNGRSPSAGSFRRNVSLTEANLLGFGDNVSLTYGNTDGSDSWDGSYTLPLNSKNGTLNLAGGTTQNRVIEPPFDKADISAASRYVDITLRQPVLRTPAEELALGITASRRESETSLLGEGFPLSPGADENGHTRISALRFFQEWTQRSNQAVFALRSQLSLGLGAFNATINEDAPDSRFLAWRGQAQWVRLLGEDTFLLLSGDVQLSSTSLVPLEQFSLGGLGSVRGYRQDALLSDNGISASVELQFPIVGKSNEGLGVLQITPFIDIGTVWNSGGRDNPDSRTLVSAGAGLRWQLGRQVAASFYWGFPFVEIDSGDRTWQENGLYFSVQSRFYF